MKKPLTGVLADNFIDAHTHRNFVSVDGKKYIAKPLLYGKPYPYYSSYWKRIKAAWRVITGKGLVVYYKEDE